MDFDPAHIELLVAAILEFQIHAVRNLPPTLPGLILDEVVVAPNLHFDWSQGRHGQTA